MAETMLRIFFTFIALLYFTSAQACEITMGYRTSERLPLIAQAPDNSGLYLDLYTQASQRIGCKLSIKRMPKKRVLLAMQTGDIDFYPGFNFSAERSRYIYYIENGLTTSFKAISSPELSDVHSVADMHSMTLLIANGGPHYGAKDLGVIIKEIEDMDLPKAIYMLNKRRADFYIYNSNTIHYYLKRHPEQQIKIHPCCTDEHPMYLGFSIHSPLIKLTPNPSYNINALPSLGNQALILNPNNIAEKLQRTLKELKDEGYIDQLIQYYYH